MQGEFVPGMFAFEIEAQCEKQPNFNVVTFDNGDLPDERVSYAELFSGGCALAWMLKKAGLGRGDRFSLVMRNHPEFLYAMLAASLTGTVLVPIDPRSKGSKLTYQIKDSGSKGIIVSNEFVPQAEEAVRELGGVKILGVAHKEGLPGDYRSRYPDLQESISSAPGGAPDGRNLDPKSPFEIIYTSGTTGDPKGVVVKADRMPMFKLLAQLVWQYQADDILYTGLSLTHGNAQAVTLGPSVMLGIPSVISRKFTKSGLWDVCRRHGATTFSLLGGMMMGLYSEPVREDDGVNPVRKVISAGTPIPIWQAFEERFGVRIHEWYGAVEGGFAHNPPGEGPLGSFGKPIEGVMEMRVVHEDDSECAPHEIGELISRRVGVREEVEYLGRKGASQEKTRGGWLRSGDMCHRDENGWFFFDFRKGGGLRRQGDFIQPEYVEKALADLSEVSDVCVYGIPASSGAPGESDIVAAIVPVNGGGIDVRPLFKALGKSLDNNSIPSYLQVVPEIPKSASEKNLDRLLRDEFSPEAPNVFAYDAYR